MAVLPNFIIPGAPKSGTTSLCNYLSQHPDIYIPQIKEPRFFVAEELMHVSAQDPMLPYLRKTSVFDWREYCDLYLNQERKIARGDASVQYLYYYENAIFRIKKRLGDVRIIIILRNPIERAFSNYVYQSMGVESSSCFSEALGLEHVRKEDGFNSFWFYLEQGFYSRPVKAYMNAFSNVFVCLYDELKRDPLSLVQRMYEFLCVDSSFVPSVGARHNVSGVPKSLLLHNLINEPNFLVESAKRLFSKSVRKRIKRALAGLNLKPATLSSEEYDRLLMLYLGDLEELELILGVDLREWKRLKV